MGLPLSVRDLGGAVVMTFKPWARPDEVQLTGTLILGWDATSPDRVELQFECRFSAKKRKPPTPATPVADATYVGPDNGPAPPVPARRRKPGIRPNPDSYPPSPPTALSPNVPTEPKPPSPDNNPSPPPTAPPTAPTAPDAPPTEAPAAAPSPPPTSTSDNVNAGGHYLFVGTSTGLTINKLLRAFNITAVKLPSLLGDVGFGPGTYFGFSYNPIVRKPTDFFSF